MNNLEVKKEHKNRYLSYAEQQKHRKSGGEFHYTLHMSTTRNYYDEEIIDRSFHYIPTWNVYAKVFSKTLHRVSTWYCRLFKEISSAFISYLESINNCLYNVAFGDLNFTDLGKTFY
jgi:hypothetical protein